MLAQVLLFALLPMAVLVLTGIIAIFRTPGPRLRSALQHFAAGVVFEAASVEVLPQVRQAHSAFPIIIGFVLGAGLVLTVSQLARRAERTEKQGKASPIGLLTVVGIDVLIDGPVLRKLLRAAK
jgi:ZIP family zinc transporter